MRKATSPVTSRHVSPNNRKRCAGYTKNHRPCRKYCVVGTDYCSHHQEDHGTAAPSTGPGHLPSSLPGMSESDVYNNEVAIQGAIAVKKRKEKAADKRKEAQKLKSAKADASKLAKSSGIEPSTVSLRTLEDCLMLIEYSVEEVLDLPPTLSKSKVLIQAARTAGQLIIQAGVSEKAVEWFTENVKLVAGVDLDQI